MIEIRTQEHATSSVEVRTPGALAFELMDPQP